MEATAARPKYSGGSAHYYTLDGQACHEVMKADKSGMRKTTLADARKLNLVPSVTTVIKILDKPALNRWKEEQVALAVLTTPRQPNEADDAFVHRVLHEEEQQEQEAKGARDLGKDIHDALDSYFSGQAVAEPMEVYVRPVIDALLAYGQKASTEVILIGDDYGGCSDMLQDCGEWWRLWDFKSAKTLPDPAKGAWMEHQLQGAAYAQAFRSKLQRAGQVKPILVGNIYISTIEPGKFVVCEHDDWEAAYSEGFAPLVRHWQYINRYKPTNPKKVTLATAQADVTTHYQVENGKLRQELEDLRAKLAVAQQNAPAPQVAAEAALEEALPPEPPKDPAEPAVIPKAVEELKKAGKKIKWSTSIVAASNGQQGVPLPGAGAPGNPSPMVEKGKPLPPGVVPGQLVTGPDGRPVWQPGKAQ